jgi:hypothetical protein
MGKVYDAVVTQRYEKNGESKNRYINVGAVFSGEKGMSLKLDSLPIGFDGWIQFYEPRDNNGPTGSQRSQVERSASTPARSAPPASSRGGELNDDIPF